MLLLRIAVIAGLAAAQAPVGAGTAQAAAETSVQVASGRLVVKAAAGAENRVILSPGRDGFLVSDEAGLFAGQGCEGLSATLARCRSAGVVMAVVDLGDGADQAGGRIPVETTIMGGPGDDTITGGPNKDSLLGGAGADVLSGGPSADTLSGGDGDDELYGDEGFDVLQGGPGDDLMDGSDMRDMAVYSELTAPVGVNLSDNDYGDESVELPAHEGGELSDGQLIEHDTLVNITFVTGGSDDDILIGTGWSLNGGPGEDRCDVNGNDGVDLSEKDCAEQ